MSEGHLTRSSIAVRVASVVGAFLIAGAVAGCVDTSGKTAGGDYPAYSPASPSATFSDGSAMSSKLVAAGEVCNQLHPFDDEAFLECVLRAESAPGSSSRSSASPKPAPSGTSPEPTTTTTVPTTTSTLAPGRLVAGTVIACPDFIEATFLNTGDREVRIVETVLFLQGGDEPFGYGTDWTPTLESGDAVTWRTTASDLGLDWIGTGPVSVGARPQTSSGEFVYADGSNPHSSCTATAPTTTTTQPPEVHGIDVTRSHAVCSADSAVFTFRITNTGNADLTLSQVALFPYEDDSHHFFEPDGWWPLPIVPPGQTVSLTEDFFFGDFWTGGSIELYVVSSSGVTIVDIPCS